MTELKDKMITQTQPLPPHLFDWVILVILLKQIQQIPDRTKAAHWILDNKTI